MFQGYGDLGDASTKVLVVLAKNSSGVPINLDALPTWRVSGPNGLVTGQTGTASFRNSASLTGATNATPIVITSTAHGLTDGVRVTITGVVGNTAANTTAVVAGATTDTFQLSGVSGNGAYVSGGVWNVVGLYSVTLTVSANNGYEAGETYDVLVSGLISAAGWADLATFAVN